MSNGLSRLAARWRRQRDHEPQVHRARLWLGAALVVLLAILVMLDPWDGVPERIAEGKHLRSIDYWRTWGWIAAAANALILGALFATARRWVVGGPVSEDAALAPPARSPGWSFLAGVLGAVLLGAWLAAPRLPMSFWDDEEYNVTHSIDGAWTTDGGELHFVDARWSDTFFFYDMPNNHVPHSILARLCLETWRLLTPDPDHGLASETVIRLPAFTAALAAVVSLAWLLWRLGFAAAGVVAAWLLVLHPWWIRYAAEARGYSMSMLGITACLVLAVRVLHRGTWGRWAAYGGGQLLLLWTNPGLPLHVALVNLAVAATLWRRHRRTPALAQQGVRFAAASGLGALAWLQLMAPNLAQLPSYLETTRGARDLGARWVREVSSKIFSGMPWHHPGERGLDPVYPELADLIAVAPAGVWTVGLAAGSALAVGAARLALRGGFRAWLPWVVLVPAPLVWALGYLRGDNLFPWYMSFVVPGLALLVALGLDGFGLALARLPARARSAGGRAPAFATAAVAAAFLAGYAWLTTAPREALRTRAYEPARDSVELTRPSLDPRHPANARVITAEGPNSNHYYDPHIRVVERPEELRALMAEADAEGKTLFFNTGRIHRQRRRWAELMALVEGGDEFERVAVLHAFEPPWSREIFRYRGAGDAASEGTDRGPLGRRR